MDTNIKNHLYHNINIKILIVGNDDQGLHFSRCTSVQIEKSVQNLTSTAKIELPREFRNVLKESDNQLNKTISIEGKSILDFIRKGDRVEIRFGYDGEYNLEFVGYITKISADTPLIIECEDEMYQLKKAKRYSGYFKSGNLKEILQAVLPENFQKRHDLEYDADYNVGKWKIENATPYEVLQQLKEKTFIRSWFSRAEGSEYTKQLNIGMTADFFTRDLKTHKLNFSQNIRRGSDIKFINDKNDTKLFLTVKSKQNNGKILEGTAGEKGEIEESVEMPPNIDKATLQDMAKKLHKGRVTNRLEGSINTWCYPIVEPGDAVDIVRPFYPDKHQDGRYFVEGVTINVNASDGIKRNVKISYIL
ncbi:hypothetical protein [Empedobacter tilapiae]|uniref:Phage late control D family protein n=1 Tax=Empedobacter tilapiae TaxID=2491114 RepID=A0A4Z1BLX7_9FLAO|nr:hypothetical protein [Empedobacter tilapiae]TGN26750.1 hypothetical protein E4J94_09905 [Empedobacter tilapiae]